MERHAKKTSVPELKTEFYSRRESLGIDDMYTPYIRDHIQNPHPL